MTPVRLQTLLLAALGAASFTATSAMLHRSGAAGRGAMPVGWPPASDTQTMPIGSRRPDPPPLPVPGATSASASTTSSAALPAPASMPSTAPAPAQALAEPSPEVQQALIDAITADDGDTRAVALNSLQNAPIALVLPLASQVLRVDPDIRNRLTALRLIVTAADRDSERDAVAQVLSMAASQTDDAVVAAQAREAYDAMTSGQGRG